MYGQAGPAWGVRTGFRKWAPGRRRDSAAAGEVAGGRRRTVHHRTPPSRARENTRDMYIRRSGIRRAIGTLDSGFRHGSGTPRDRRQRAGGGRGARTNGGDRTARNSWRCGGAVERLPAGERGSRQSPHREIRTRMQGLKRGRSRSRQVTSPKGVGRPDGTGSVPAPCSVRRVHRPHDGGPGIRLPSRHCRRRSATLYDDQCGGRGCQSGTGFDDMFRGPGTGSAQATGVE